MSFLSAILTCLVHDAALTICKVKKSIARLFCLHKE